MGSGRRPPRKQNPRGYWAFPEDCYWPKWSATVWNIILLGEMGISPSHPSVMAGCEYILNTAMSQDKSWPPKSQSGPESYRLLWEPCVTGNMARTFAVFGYGRDPACPVNVRVSCQDPASGRGMEL